MLFVIGNILGKFSRQRSWFFFDHIQWSRILIATHTHTTLTEAFIVVVESILIQGLLLVVLTITFIRNFLIGLPRNQQLFGVHILNDKRKIRAMLVHRFHLNPL